jgi:hypothetical protein
MRTFQIVLGGGILLGVDYDLIITSLLFCSKEWLRPYSWSQLPPRVGERYTVVTVTQVVRICQ